jgi:hypothetical protein
VVGGKENEMANRFVTVLQKIGHDFKIGLDKILPFAVAAEAPIAALDPALGALFQTAVGVVSSIEQKFTAMGQQAGTGAQKLAEATQILFPVVQQIFSSAGKQSDLGTVQNYISQVVNFLNAIPAAGTAPASPAPPTQ